MLTIRQRQGLKILEHMRLYLVASRSDCNPELDAENIILQARERVVANNAKIQPKGVSDGHESE